MVFCYFAKDLIMSNYLQIPDCAADVNFQHVFDALIHRIKSNAYISK